MGMVTNVKVTASPVGVMMAATMAMPTMAWRRYFLRVSACNNPALAKR